MRQALLKKFSCRKASLFAPPQDLAKLEEESRKQMLLLQALVEGVKKQGEAAVCKAESDKNVKVAN